MQVQVDTVSISKLIFGTMRLKTQSSYNDYYTLFNEMFERGIDTHHISHEYESYTLYLKLHKQLKNEQKHFKHISKIASPDFKDKEFNASSFEKRIDEELIRLGKDQIEVVQWMYRMENFDDEVRTLNLEEQYDVIEYTFEKLKKTGKVLVFGHFPYTPTFATKVADLGLSSLLITYLNIFELSYQNFAEQLPMIAIRPFAAGKINELLNKETTIKQIGITCNLTENQVHACIKLFPLLYPTVKAVVLSLNNEAQLKDILRNYNEISDLKIGNYDCKTIISTIKMLPINL